MPVPWSATAIWMTSFGQPPTATLICPGAPPQACLTALVRGSVTTSASTTAVSVGTSKGAARILMCSWPAPLSWIRLLEAQPPIGGKVVGGGATLSGGGDGAERASRPWGSSTGAGARGRAR